VAALLGMGSQAGDVIADATPTGTTPYGWADIAAVDRRNIRQYLRERRREGAEDHQLRHELTILVGTAADLDDGALSSARLRAFDEPDDRPGRPIARFLVFVGAERPPCPKCGTQTYGLTTAPPGELRCRGCAFRVTIRELTFFVPRHSARRLSAPSAHPR
jgi:hypothetical protein